MVYQNLFLRAVMGIKELVGVCQLGEGTCANNLGVLINYDFDLFPDNFSFLFYYFLIC